MVTKLGMLVFALKLVGYQVNSIEEMTMREEARNAWQKSLPPFLPESASPSIPAFSP